MLDSPDTQWMEHARELARTAEDVGNRPVGAVIVLDERIVAEGRDRTREPTPTPGRHAVIRALEAIAAGHRDRSAEMTCYTTLEPCPMCTGALRVHGVGRLVFDIARDEGDGARDELEVVGPVSEPTGASPAELRDRLEAWLANDTESAADALSLQEAREAWQRLEDQLEPDAFHTLLPYAVAVFRQGGYLKDYRALRRLAKRAGHPEWLDDVGNTLREHLPDIWVRRALESGDCDRAAERWFAVEDHSRARLVADELVEACADGYPELRMSCRLAQVSHLVERGGRKRYRTACTILRRLRDELERAGEATYWRHILDDLKTTYDNRPAFLEELDNAGFE